MSEQAEAFAQQVALCWSRATATTYRKDNPSLGQCSVTALLAQEVLGGTLERTRVGGAWHYYNRIGGRRHDFTATQFVSPIGYDDLPCSLADALADTSADQVQALRTAYRLGNTP